MEYRYIYIQTIKKKWKPGLRMIPDDLKDEYYSDWLYFMAEEFRDEIVRAINLQRFKNNNLSQYKSGNTSSKGWPPLNLAYYKWKKKKKYSLKMWEATGFLKNKLTLLSRDTRGDDAHIMVGFKFYTLYPQRDVSPLLVSRVLEFGSDVVPPRPLFRPMYIYMRKNVRGYWKKFKKREGIK